MSYNPTKYASIRKTGTTALSLPQTITFDVADADVGGWFSGGNPSRLTVPSGVDRVRLFTFQRFANDTGGNAGAIFTNFLRNGSALSPLAISDNHKRLGNATASSTIANNSATLFSPVLTATPGDYFESRINMDGSGLITALSPIQPGSTFSIVDLTGYRGAIMRLSADQNNDVNDLNPPAKVLCDTADIDTDSIFDSTNRRLVVPSGVNRIRLYAQLRLTNNIALFSFRLEIRKNGTQFPDLGNGVSRAYHYQGGANNSGFSENFGHYMSPVIEVTPGDYFELWAGASSTSNVVDDILAAGTYLEMEIID